MDFINYAEYGIMLNSNTVTDNVRDEYFSTKNKNHNEYLDAFCFILRCVFDGIKNNSIDSKTAKTIVETEYNKSCLCEIFGEYSSLSIIVNDIIDRVSSSRKLDTIDDFKYYISIADTLDIYIAMNIYYLILSKMCYNYLILKDTDFTKKIINYINTNSVDFDGDSKLFHNLFDYLI